jgi:hypothetical protein
MPRNTRRRVSLARCALMTLLILGALAGVVALVRALPASPAGHLAAVVLGALALPVAASPLEWLVHRYVYHRRIISFLRRIYVIHQQGHHHVLFPTWRYVTNGPVRRHPILTPSASVLYTSLWRNLSIKLCHFSFYMGIGVVCVWLPAWLLTENVAFLAGLVAASAVVSDLFVRVHDAIHYPGQHRFVEAQPWFRFLEVHHYIHHVDTEANVNFLLPLADWLFGTLRRRLTDEELARHGPLEEARARPVGMSEPAHTVARPRRSAAGDGAHSLRDPQEPTAACEIDA